MINQLCRIGGIIYSLIKVCARVFVAKWYQQQACLGVLFVNYEESRSRCFWANRLLKNTFESGATSFYVYSEGSYKLCYNLCIPLCWSFAWEMCFLLFCFWFFFCFVFYFCFVLFFVISLEFLWNIFSDWYQNLLNQLKMWPENNTQLLSVI